MPVVSVTIESANDTTVYITERQKFVVQIPGNPGLSAYGVAVKNGFVGTEEEWLASLQGGGANVIWGEEPAGLINGINAIFTTEFDIQDGKIQVLLNGLLQKLTVDYNLTGANEFTFLSSPLTNDQIIVNYEKVT